MYSCPHPCCPDTDKEYYPKKCKEGYECVNHECKGGDNENNNYRPPYAKISCLSATEQSPAKLSLQIKTYSGSPAVSAELTIYLPDGVEKHGTKGAFTCTQSICTTKEIDISAGELREIVLEIQSIEPKNYKMSSGEILWKWRGSTDRYNALPLDTSNCNVFVRNMETKPEPGWEKYLYVIIGALLFILIIIAAIVLIRK